MNESNVKNENEFVYFDLEEGSNFFDTKCSVKVPGRMKNRDAALHEG